MAAEEIADKKSEAKDLEKVSKPLGELATSAEEKKPFEYSILKDPLMRMRYVLLTSMLIDEILEERADTVIFMDKSARPVSWLVSYLWPLLAADRTGNEAVVPKKPDFKFLNIDRRQWLEKTGSYEDETGGLKVDRTTVGQDIQDLRAAFMVSRGDIEKGKETENLPARLDNQNIMIVDEVRVSGTTLDIAKKLAEQAFPTSKISATHWMVPPIAIDKSGTRYNADVPIWYTDKTILGRGIGSKDSESSKRSPFAVQRVGHNFFSRPLRIRDPERPHQTTDPESVLLREEMKQLAKEVSTGDIPLRMGTRHLSLDALEKRLKFMEEVNGISAQKVVSLLKQANNNPTRFMELYKEARQKG